MSEINELHNPTINPISLVHYQNRGRVKMVDNLLLKPTNLQSGFASRSEQFEETNLSRAILAPITVNPLTQSLSGFQNPNSSPQNTWKPETLNPRLAVVVSLSLLKHFLK
ncbi:hypothetical protein AMTRI_Chr06g169550 [Amborella trichopoda]